MSEELDQAAASPNRICVLCSKPLVEGWEFCPFCGAKTLPSSTTSAIDTYVQSKINLELSNRLKDQGSLVREIGDKAEDIVWTRLKRYGVIFGVLLTVILGVVAFVGIKTLGDVSKKIEPMVSDFEQRAQVAKQTMEETATKVDSIKASLDQLSRDVEVQTKRVAEKGGEISQKLESLDAVANEAQTRGETYQARSEELSRRLEAMQKALENKVEQVSKQVDTVSIRQVYPTLGQQKFATFNGGRWKGAAEKGAGEKWINIYIDSSAIGIDSSAIGDVSTEQVEKLTEELRHSGYTPFIGGFGIGGPYFGGIGAFGLSDETTVFYFQHNSEHMAVDVAAMVSETLSIKALEPRFVDITALPKDWSFAIENSGLDLQVFLFRSPR